MLLAFDNPLRRSFVPEMVSKDDLPNAVVLYSTIVALSQVSGPALAGALVATVGFGWCFALDAVTYLAVIACLVMMRERELFRQPPRARTGREVREGLAYVASVPRLWISFAMFALHRALLVQPARRAAAARDRGRSTARRSRSPCSTPR